MSHAPRLTERKFGLVMSGALGLIGLLVFFVFAGNPTWLWAIAVFFLLSAILLPAYLLPLNRLWEKLAARLAYFNNHLLLGLFFYLFVWPTGIMMRLFGRDPMQRRRDPKAFERLTAELEAARARLETAETEWLELEELKASLASGG